MRTWSRRRRVLTVMGSLLFLFVAAVIAVPFLVPAEKWKQLAFEQLEKQTKLRGSAESASVSLLPLGLKLGKLRIEDPERVTGLASMDFALESVVVRASLGSILRGAPEVQEVRLVRPDLELTLPAPSAADSNVGPAKAAPPEVAAVLGLLSIVDGHVVVHDPAGTTFELGGIENRASVRVNAGRLDATLGGSIATVAARGDSLPAPLNLPPIEWDATVQAALDGTGGVATLERVEMAGLRASGRVGWQLPSGSPVELDLDLDLQAELATLWTQLLRDLAAAQPLPAPWTPQDFELLAGTATAKLTMKGALPDPDPADPSVALRPFVADGEVTGLRVRVIDRSDLATIAGRLRLQEGVLHLEQVTLAGALGTAKGAFSLPLSLTSPLRGDVDADLDLAALRTLGEQWWPRFAATAGEDAVGPEEWPQLQGRAQAQAALAIAADGSFDPLTADAGAITWTVRSERFVAQLPTVRGDVVISGARVRGDLKEARIEQGHVVAPGLEGDAQLVLSGWPEKTVVRGEVRASRVDLDALQKAMAIEEETAQLDSRWFDRGFGVREARAQKSSAAKDELPPPPPATLDVAVDLRAQEVTSAGYTLRDVQGRTTLVEQKLQVDDISGALGSGRITGDASVDWTVQPPHWGSDLKANEVPASALLEPVAGPLANALTATLSGDVDLDGPLALDPVQIVAALSGGVKMQSSRGSLAAESLLGPTVSQFLGKAADRWRQLDFSSLTANMSVREGRVHFDRVFLTGDTEVQAVGSVGLDGTPAYRLDVRLPRGVVPELGALQPVADLLKDDQGRMAFGVNVSGSAKKPQVEIDFNDLQRRAQKSGEGKVRDALRDQLGVGTSGEAKDKVDQAIGGKLDDLLGGTKTAAPESSATDSTVVDPKQQLEDKAKDAAGSLLDRLKRKKGGGGSD